MIFLGESMTLNQAAQALGITRAELRPLHESGDIVVKQIAPGAWRVDAQTVRDLLDTPEWAKRRAT